MLAYHNDSSIKTAILAQLAAHREADELIKGQYWEHGKGCAIGCTIHSDKHVEYEMRFGIPQMLARLEDHIFEGLPNGSAKQWPERFMSSIRPGADLTRVGWQFLHWLLTDPAVNPGIEHPLVRDAVRQCADVIAVLKDGGSAASAAESAAWSAESAAESAESAAESAESAAESAESAAWSAESAARSAARSAASAAESAESAARSAESAAWSAAWSAASAAWSAAWSAESAAESAESAARSAARSAAYSLMADKLIELIGAA